MEPPATAPVRSAPSMIGPYRALELLGQGGMGRVYRAEHQDTGELVAVKTVRAVDETRLSSIRREIYALSRVRHPGVVRILDQGVSQGVPWYAMELLEGPTLAHVLTVHRRAGGDTRGTGDAAATGTITDEIAPAPGQPEARAPALPSWSSESFLQVIRGLCAPLACLHASGVVHRDLKPDNIFLRAGGLPMITDLGIATRFAGTQSREELLADGRVLGTCLYMAPEQIRGEHVDARADLYALGCILYECVTGQPPFTGVASHVLSRHLDEQPLPPSRIAPGIAPELDALVLSLLAKRPRDRLGYAEDVDAALERLDVPGVPWPGADRPRAYLYRPQLAGRDQPLAELEARLARMVRERRGGSVLVGGESGVGKTRLVMELARQARQLGVAVVSGQCQALAAAQPGNERRQAAPLHPLRPLLLAIADRCRELGASATERLLGARGLILAAYELSLADLPYERDHLEPPVLPADQARDRLFRALQATLFACADDRPLVLVLDDLQWADELSLGFLRYLDPAELAAHRVLVIGTYRMDEVSPELEAIAAADGVGHIELGRLDAASVRAIIGDMLAMDAPPRHVAEFLAETSSGNPFFVAEYMQSAIGEGLITRDRGAWRVEAIGDHLEVFVPLPRSLTGLIERRIAGLDPDCRHLVLAAAVLGRAFEAEILAMVADAGDSADEIETLRRRQIVEEGDAGQLRFVHDKIREIAYATIPPAQAAELHRRAALAIERVYGDEPTLYQSLAHHWSSAGVLDRAALCFMRAADYARASYANREALGLFLAALERISALAGAADSARVRHAWQERQATVCEHIGDLLAMSGQQVEARDAYSDVLAIADPRDRVRLARLYRKIGKSWETHHRHDNALSAYGAAGARLGQAPVLDDADWWHEWFQLQNDRIYVHYWLAQVAEMTALVEAVRPVVMERGTPRQRAAFFDGLLHTWLRRQRYQLGDEALSAAHQALDAALASADAACVANARFMLGLALLFAGERGDLAAADREMAQALRHAERIGDVTLQSRCATYATVIQRRLGRVAEVEAMAARSLALAQETRMLDYAGAAWANLAWAAWRRGDGALAREHGEAALRPWEMLASSHTYGMQWPGRLLLIVLDVEDGRIERAVGHARLLLDASQVALPAELNRALAAALDAWHAGDPERARAALVRATGIATNMRYL